jgi:hypothetical protein
MVVFNFSLALTAVLCERVMLVLASRTDNFHVNGGTAVWAVFDFFSMGLLQMVPVALLEVRMICTFAGTDRVSLRISRQLMNLPSIGLTATCCNLLDREALVKYCIYQSVQKNFSFLSYLAKIKVLSSFA